MITDKTYTKEEIQRAMEVYEAFRSNDLDVSAMRRLEELAEIGVYIKSENGVPTVMLDGGGDICACKLSLSILNVEVDVCSDPPQKRPE